MDKSAPEILQLRMDIEESVRRKLRTPYDFMFLTGAIWERLHENISHTTLKRLWCNMEDAEATRRTALCLLARFLGHADWEAYLEDLKSRKGIESETSIGEGIQSDIQETSPIVHA